MREELLREIENELEVQRRENELTEHRRKEEISRLHPEIEILTRERENLVFGTLRSILQGEAKADDLPEKMVKLNQQIRKKLEENGYPADYLAPVYHCPLCKDTGVIGETIRNPCECVNRRYQEKWREKIGLAGNGQETFENFRTDIYSNRKEAGSNYSTREYMMLVKSTCEQWSNQYPKTDKRDLMLSGQSGLGKTFLLRAMASRLIERNIPVLLISAYDLQEIMRNEYFEGGNETKESINTEVLMIDDLGSEPFLQNISVEQLFRVINERQNKNRATVISTNLIAEELQDRYTERIMSRMNDKRTCMYIPLTGDDIRTTGKEG